MQDFTRGKNKSSEQVQQQHSRKTKLERVSHSITKCEKVEKKPARRTLWAGGPAAVKADIEEVKRKTGIDILGDVPWGTHFCLFYQDRHDLIDILVPYLRAGLENNEFCMWITSEPLNAKDAKQSLKRAVKNLDKYIRKGQIEIVDYRQWYKKMGKFETDRVLQGWIEKHDQAIKRGFDGLRLTGNTFWLEQEDWREFAEYEATVNSVIGKYKMVAICAYSLDRCGANEVIDVVSNHQFALIKRQGRWEIVESTQRKRAEEALRESEARYRVFVETAPDVIYTIAEDGILVSLNSVFETITGWSRSEWLGKHFAPLVHPDDLPTAMETFKSVLSGKKLPLYELRILSKSGEYLVGEFTSTPHIAGGKVVGEFGIVRDITERKRSEEAYRALVDHSLQGLAIFQDGHVVFVNQAMAKITGFTVEEILTMTSNQVREFVHPEDRVMVWNRYRYRLQGKRVPEQYELRGIRSDGSVCWLDIHARRIQYQGKLAVQAAYVDITERKKAEDELKTSENKYRTLLQNLPQKIFLKDRNSVYISCNENYARDLRIKTKDIAGKTDYEFYPKELAEKYRADDKRLMESAVTEDIEEKYIQDGKELFINTVKTPVSDEKGNVIGILGIFWDITKRKQAEQKLREHEAQLKSLASQLTLAEERERRRIAVELHDRIGQSLAVSKIMLDGLRHGVSRDDPANVMQEVCSSLGQTITDIRSLTFDLSSPILYELGLGPAVDAWLLEEIEQKHGIAAELEEDEKPKPLDDDIRVLLFRDVRELLINIVKHSRATKVKVSIRCVGDQIRISVEDNGVGFVPAEVTPKAVRKGGFGLFSIRERLEELGGHLEIESEPDNGCKVVMTAPLKHGENKE